MKFSTWKIIDVFFLANSNIIWYLQSTLPVLLVCHFWVHIFIHGTKLNHAAFGHGLCLTKLGWIAAFFSAKFANLGPESKGNPFLKRWNIEHQYLYTSLDIIFGKCKVLKVLKHQKTRLVSLPRKATKWTEYVPSLLEKEGTMTDERKGNLDRFEHSLPFVFVWHLPLTNPLLICWLKQYDYWFPISSSNPPWIMNLHNPELLVY